MATHSSILAWEIPWTEDPGGLQSIESQRLRHSSVQFSRSVMSNSLQPHGLQHARPPCLSPTPGVYSNSCPLIWWCHPTISSSVIPFSSCLQSFPASRISSESVLHIRWLKYWNWTSASSSVFPLGLTPLISLQSKRLSGVFSNTVVQKHHFFSAQITLWSNYHIHI